MPWKTKNEQQQRYELVRGIKVGMESVAQICRQAGVSRKTAYKWLKRHGTGGLGALANQKRKPKQVGRRTPRCWLERLRRLRRKHPTWGARKLRHRLVLTHRRERVPAVATLGRWLKRWGLAKGVRRRRVGPLLERAQVSPARQPNEVWTVDFKGWYRTADGTRVDPLTVRDLYSRYGLAVVLQQGQTVEETKRQFRRIFRKYGLPKRIRCDNGVPFGGGGPTGLTRLSGWWVKLGIQVEFITPGRPCENGAHEQFHRVYKAEVAKAPALRLAEQQRRSNRWLRQYNQERPHEALDMKVPAQCYRKSRRGLPLRIKKWSYPKGWIRRWVKGNGQMNWRGQRWFVGEAFVRDYVGLKSVRPGVWRVYYGPILVGELHENDLGSIRPAKYARNRKGPSHRVALDSLRSPRATR